MKTKQFTRISSLAFLLTVIAVSVLVSEHATGEEANDNHWQHYRVIDLGTLGGSFSQAFGVNNEGWVVGFSTLAGDASLHAFLWRNGVMTDLGTLGEADTLPYSSAGSLNDAGQIVGLSETSIPDPFGDNFCGDSLICKPVVWVHGAINTLPTLGGINGTASDVNGSGQVVGVAETDEPIPPCGFPYLFRFEAVLWEHGRPIPLPGIGDDTVGFALAVNDNGEVLGVTGNCSGDGGHSVLWQHLKPLDITRSSATDDLELSPNDLNNRTQVTGTAFDASGSISLAYIWRDGYAKIIGALPNHVESHGNAINDRGQIVGQSCSQNGFPDCSVFLWQKGSMNDLNDLVPSGSISMVDSGKINNRGQVVGLAITNEGQFHAFLATPSNSREGEGPTSDLVANRPKPVVTVPEVARRALEHRTLLRSHSLSLRQPSNKPH